MYYLSAKVLGIGSGIGEGVSMNMRMRIACTIVRDGSDVDDDTFHILNDLVVDRGPSAFMSQLELFVDGRHLTSVQADGIVISTPTGTVLGS